MRKIGWQMYNFTPQSKIACMHFCYKACVLLLLGMGSLLYWGCQAPTPKPPPVLDGSHPFFTEKNAQHNGDYLATYPLQHTDSCLLKLKAEVPEALQPWACLSIWYRLPRTSPEVNFRWLAAYEQHYPHDTVFAFTQMMRGEFLTEMYQFDSARTILADARQRYLALGRPLDASDADYLLARGYNQENKVAQALESYMQVLDLINRHDTTFSHRHIYLYFDLATVHGRNKNHTQQLYWLKKAQQGDSTRLDQPWKYHISIANRMSAHYALTSQFDSSLLMAQAAVDLFKTHVNKPLPGEFLYRLGFAHYKKGDTKTAMPLLRQAHARQPDEGPNSFMKNQIQQALGECYFKLGQLDSARLFTQLSLATPDTGNLATAHRRLSEIYALQRQYPQAYEEAKKSLELFRRFYQIERATAVSDFEVRYQTAEKQHQITRMEARHRIAQQRNLIIALGLLLLIGLLTTLTLRQRSLKRMLEQDKKLLEANHTLLEQEKALAEAQAQLKAQELERSQHALLQTQSELDRTTHLLVFKDQFIEALQLRLSEQASKAAEQVGKKPSLTGIKILTELDWIQFQKRFDDSFPGFLKNLKTTMPQLTSAEVRLFLLTRMGFSAAEISDALGISKDSVWRSRHRLSKKLGLTETGSLDEFVQQFGT